MVIWDTGSDSAAVNMEYDFSLLREGAKEPVLHLYDWKRPSCTYGHFIQPDKVFDLEAVEALQIDLAKRPTGGGVTFHLTDFAFSLFIPVTHPFYRRGTLESYQAVHSLLQKGLVQGVTMVETESDCSLFCSASQTRYDLILEGKKVGGAAQRRGRTGLLHQGSLFLQEPPYDVISKILIDGPSIIEKIKRESCSLYPPCQEDLKLICKDYLSRLFMQHLV